MSPAGGDHGTGFSYTSSGNALHLDFALQNQISILRNLEKEIDEFVALPRDAFHEREERELDRLEKLNPSTARSELRQLFSASFEAAANPNLQAIEKFWKPFVASFVGVTITSAALSEAFINTTLAIGLHHSSKSDLFSFVDRAELMEKWVRGPKLFLDSYHADEGREPIQTLKHLTGWRNSLVHAKVELVDSSGSLVLKGSAIEAIGIGEKHRKLLNKFCALPYRLHKMLCDQITDASLRFFIESISNQWGEAGKR